MKRLLLIASLVFASGAQATQVDWKTQLENYKQNISKMNTAQLVGRTAFYSVAAAGTCAYASVMVAAAFISDAAPITAPIAEIIANNSDPSYQTWDKIISLDTLANTGKGLVGGGVVGAFEALEFVNLWLGGNEDLAFGHLKQTFASSFAVVDNLFSDKSQCLMSYAKVLLTRLEMKKRSVAPAPYQAPQDPLEMSRP